MFFRVMGYEVFVQPGFNCETRIIGARGTNDYGCVIPGNRGSVMCCDGSTCPVDKKTALALEALFSVEGMDSLPFFDDCVFGTNGLCPDGYGGTIAYGPPPFGVAGFSRVTFSQTITYKCILDLTDHTVFFKRGTLDAQAGFTSDGQGFGGGPAPAINADGALTIPPGTQFSDVFVLPFCMPAEMFDQVVDFGITHLLAGAPYMTADGDLFCGEEKTILFDPSSTRARMLASGTDWVVDFSFCVVD